MKQFIAIILMCILGICYVYAEGWKQALLIGISDYPQYKDASLSWKPVHGTNDIGLIRTTLHDYAYGLRPHVIELVHYGVSKGVELAIAHGASVFHYGGSIGISSHPFCESGIYSLHVHSVSHIQPKRKSIAICSFFVNFAA